jgi:hypothetical protein
MPAPKGNKYSPGRPKGKPNKSTTSVKEAFRLAFEGIGGVKALIEWAKDEKTEFFKIYSKLLPKELEVSGTDGGPIKAQVEVIFADSKHKS